MIAANILARPLCLLAGGVIRHLAPGGHLILSGFVPADGQRVLSAYRSRGLILVRRITRADWQTLVLRKPLRTDALQRTASS
ncbi:MAG: 50S ribosomal protein L11 methyltransferase [Rhodospirillales bacterium]|nr:50S ribosomal protein L11 methyltransferase [Rhodospirillales bacterium]